MIESKSLTVPPSLENSTIDLWQTFGWTLKSTQEINTSESHLEDRGGDLYSVTSSQNYVKLAFQRDTSIPNYARIKELEAEYHAILDSEPTDLSKAFEIKTILIIGVILLFLFAVPGVIFLIFMFKKRNQAKKMYIEEYNAWSEKMNTEGEKILAEVSSLVS